MRLPSQLFPMHLRRVTRLVAGLLLAALPVEPARALETIRITLPMMQETFTLKVSDLRDPRAMDAASSDLAELNRATNGAIGRSLASMLDSDLPLQLASLARVVQGSSLVDQALLLIAALGDIDGLSVPPTVGRDDLERALRQTAANQGRLTLADVLAAVPGQTATVDLNRFLAALRRLQRQQAEALPLLASVAPARDDQLGTPGARPYRRRTQTLAVSHRTVPLRVVLIEPSSGANGRLVVISHGLWDSPLSFEAWANHLASHGYTVLLPEHPGSDAAQQHAMLSGKAAPPGPDELKLRPRDVSALIDAAADGRLGLRHGVDTSRVLAAGHSWGATTVLQLAGVTPSSERLRETCNNVRDPSHNLSWVLQCSFLTAADQAGLADRRVQSVVAVSPPMRLLFAPGAARAMHGTVLLVSGTRDWVVPVGPEAIDPMRKLAANTGIGRNRLVLAEGGDHFNLRAPAASADSPLNALILAWFGSGASLPTDGWAHKAMPLRDVTGPLIQP
jgi:predicted dienelactone hydrolase